MLANWARMPIPYWFVDFVLSSPGLAGLPLRRHDRRRRRQFLQESPDHHSDSLPGDALPERRDVPALVFSGLAANIRAIHSRYLSDPGMQRDSPAGQSFLKLAVRRRPACHFVCLPLYRSQTFPLGEEEKLARMRQTLDTRVLAPFLLMGLYLVKSDKNSGRRRSWLATGAGTKRALPERADLCRNGG